MAWGWHRSWALILIPAVTCYLRSLRASVSSSVCGGAPMPRAGPAYPPFPLPRHGPPALQLALSLPRCAVGCEQGPPGPVYLPAALELLDAPEHFRVQQLGRYPPANASLAARSETFLLLQPWPRAQPLLRASYPPFATQQVRGRGSRDRGRRLPGAARACPAPFPEREAEAHEALSCRAGPGAWHPISPHLTDPPSFPPPC